jgi:hypothetical protein
MKLSEENWPKPPRCNGEESEIALSETVKSDNKSTTHSLTVLEKKHNTVNVGRVVDCHRYSSNTRLLRVTAYVFRFVGRIKGQTVDKTLELSADELIEAEQMWIKDIQNNMFPEEVKQLINRTKTFSSRLDQLRLFLDDKGMIRCEGRIEHSSVSSEAKKPVLIPAKHHVTDLIIQEHHDSANHTGIKGTLNCIRERYWILHGRQVCGYLHDTNE